MERYEQPTANYSGCRVARGGGFNLGNYLLCWPDGHSLLHQEKFGRYAIDRGNSRAVRKK